jgi:prepilin-type N-terminal cleavage/methylation domain-containing protein
MRSGTATSRNPWPRATDRRGFTMVELLITLTVLAAVMVVLMTVMYAAQRSKTATSNRVESVQGARIAMDLLARDLRSAGYGADQDWATPQPPIAYIDSLQVLINANLYPWPDALPDQIKGGPQAYQPTGWPRPAPLNGTAWQPAIKYRTGAEIIRWTLDVNNDGKPDSLDWTDVDGMDAQRTPNQNDYVLVREVYGDSIGNVAGNNWGVTERIALIQKPTSAGAPALFNVYLTGSTSKWDWSSGPVPVSELGNIERIEVNVTAGSSRPDTRGVFATTSLTTEINSMRNVPNFGAPTFNVDGYVFDDNVIENGVRDSGEPGLGGATVRLGIMSTVTDVNGYYLFKAQAGTHTLRHVPPPGFGVYTSPDSFVVTVGPAVSHSFADTAMAGGWVTSFTYHDVDGDAVYDVSGDTVLAVTRVTVTPGDDIQYTNSSGYATNFAPVGSYTVTVTAPDSFAATTPNPESGVMSAGGSAAYSFGFRKSGMGTVRGKVFVDNDRDGVHDTGELGIEGVYVAVTPDAGSTVVGWQYTDANGDYAISAPEVQSPAAPYYVMTIVKPGYYPTSPTSIGPFYLSTGEVRSGNDFGEVGYQVIVLTASRVLSLASADLIEADGSGNKPVNGRGDTDLILGADATGADQISTWFNQYDNTPVFNSSPTRSYTAQSSVLSIAADTLDNTATWRHRPDIATGTANATGGNFFIWLVQNTNNNEGYLPTNANLAYRTQDMGDVQSILSYQCAGGGMPDLIVGTKSPTANQGTIEVWENDNAATPTFARREIYPPNGLIPGDKLGEVAAMALADFDGDGLKDLAVATRTGSYSGQLLFFKHVSNVDGARFVYQCGYDLDSDAATSLVCFDIDGDGLKDAIVGTQSSLSQGHLMQWGNKFDGLVWKFELDRQVAAPGVVQSLATADFGGSVRGDLAVGFRSNMASYVGGIRIYFCDAGKIPALGGDPSGGSVANMVPAVTTGNYNYGVRPALPSPPYLTDLATGVKITATTGALVVYLR